MPRARIQRLAIATYTQSLGHATQVWIIDLCKRYSRLNLNMSCTLCPSYWLTKWPLHAHVKLLQFACQGDRYSAESGAQQM
jgi:hypothetical protein